jgi:D-alanine-D-alanine ligase
LPAEPETAPMPDPRVLILYNEPVLPPGHPEYDSEQEVLYSAQVIGESLQREGIPMARLGITSPAGLLDGLQATSPDVVFNLYEGIPGQEDSEVGVAALLEWLRVPFTGCPSHALVLARNKPLVKLLLTASGIATPEYFLVERGDRCPPNPLGWPVIAKPGRGDASVGIDQGAVATSDRQLRDRVDRLFAEHDGPVLVERFITGREIHATVVDLGAAGVPTVLPLAEIRFEPDDNLWPIYTYDAKWKEQSREYQLRPVDIPAKGLPADVADRLTEAADRTYRLVGCRDYARIDIRLAPDGTVYVLECNPNPSITSVMMENGLELLGWDYDVFMARMVRNAHARGGAAGVNPRESAPPQAAGA